MARRGLNSQVILEAALELAEEQGLSRLTVGNLAKRLEVKPASLYNHVGGMEEVQELLTLRAMELLEQALRGAATGRSGGEALREMALAYRRFAREHPELYRLFIQSKGHHSPRREERGKRIMEVIYQVAAPYVPTQEEKIHFSRMFRSALHGFIALEAAGFFNRGPGAEVSYVHMVEQLVRLLLDRDAARPSTNGQRSVNIV